MTTLYLVRHAKSSWKNLKLSDLDRPLNKRGKRDAPFMGRLLKKMNEYPDLIISSPAKRAFSTAKRFSKELDYPIKKILKDEKLYMAEITEFVSVIKKTHKSVKRLMLFVHNYGITNFANFISQSNIENIPTAGVVRIDFEFKSWKDIDASKGKLTFFEFPKKYSLKNSV